MKKILILFFVGLMIGGCNDCKDDSILNAEELSWMPYHGGETLIFQNLSGVNDTLIVGQRIISTLTIGDMEAEDHSPCTYTIQELDVKIGLTTFMIAHKNMDVTYSIPIWPGNTQGGDIPELGVGNIRSSPFFSTVVLNGKTFSNIYNVEDDYYGNTYYSKLEGVVAINKGVFHDSLYVKIN
jgi:hypothetical protein